MRRAPTELPAQAGSLEEELRACVGRPYRPPMRARDPVNLPMIRHLTDALGDRNPVYTDEAFARRTVFGGIVAPPTSLQVWTMPGLAPREAGAPPRPRVMQLLDDHGYVGVAATDCEQTYHRYLRPGDVLTVESVVESVSDRKRTALGEGYFVTTLDTFRDQHGEVVGEMRFRLLKFKPGTGREPETAGERRAPPRPPLPAEEEFFWAGVEDHEELRIQRCAACGRLRHPPRPACPWCRSFDWDFVVASGRGEVYSFVVHHHPPVPHFDHPFVVALVELEEGTRIVGNLVDCDPSAVRVGMPVELVFRPNPAGRKLPQWRPREA